jgi:hypothetical protein
MSERPRVGTARHPGAASWVSRAAGAAARVAGRVGRPVSAGAGTSLGVFVAGLLLMLALQGHFRAFAHRGVYFQEHSSEDMMQTISLVDLRDQPWESLLVLHIQPPLLDGLRALLAHLWPGLGRWALVLRVDRSLNLIWMLAYSAMALLVFRWLRRLVSSERLAALAALLFLFHPAAIYYATYPEGTLLTSFGVLWMCYALWAVPARGATFSLGAAFLFLFSVRSIFQWPALLLLVAALVLRRAPRRSVRVFTVACSLVVGSFMLKQYLVLGTTSTSSFGGSSCLHALGQYPEMGISASAAKPTLGPLFPYRTPADYPAALTRSTKITGSHNFNTLADLANERELMQRCAQRLASSPLWSTLGSYAENASIFFEPSSRYELPHEIVDRLPWRGVYDWVLSGPRLLILLVAGGIGWARHRSRDEMARGLGLALPLLYVAVVCMVFEKDDNMRFKFFIEPVLFVFLVAQAAALARARRRRDGAHEAAATETPR